MSLKIQWKPLYASSTEHYVLLYMVLHGSMWMWTGTSCNQHLPQPKLQSVLTGSSATEHVALPVSKESNPGLIKVRPDILEQQIRSSAEPGASARVCMHPHLWLQSALLCRWTSRSNQPLKLCSSCCRVVRDQAALTLFL